MNCKDLLKEKLKKFKREDIIITNHAYDQAVFRCIDVDEIKNNITNPVRLQYAAKQEAKQSNEEKYDCYFGYSRTQCHRYVIVINGKCIVCTVVKINRRWQRIAEKNARF